VAFWEDVVAKSPGNPRAHNNLGYSLAGACRLPEAEAALSRALELDPELVRAAVNLRLLREGAALRPGEAPCPRAGSAPAVP
jgi:Flp pilus assembly protein TadD